MFPEKLEVNSPSTNIESNIVYSANGSMVKSGTVLSPNYHSQSRGWKLDSNGIVEFLQGIITSNVLTETKFRKLLTEPISGVSIWISSDRTTPDGNLTGVQGDICLNGTDGKPFYCSVAGKNDWLALV